MTPALVAVVAMARNGVIGRDGAMPWRLATDLRRFRRLTLGKPAIMGRRTLESIGRLLDGRDTIVVTRQGHVPYPGAHVAAGVDEALSLGGRLARDRGAEEIAVVGGGEIYRLFLDRLDRLYVTFVDAEPDGDATFPSIDPNLWREVREEAVPAGGKDSAASRFVVFDRRRET